MAHAFLGYRATGGAAPAMKTEEKKIETPLCKTGHVFTYHGAPKCLFWSCECEPGACVPAKAVGGRQICSKPCKTHYPNGPIKCLGGRGRIMPDGCLVWQCNCPFSVWGGKCIKPKETGAGEPICDDPCKGHEGRIDCSKCKCPLSRKERESVGLWPWKCANCLEGEADEARVKWVPPSERKGWPWTKPA